MNFHKKDNPSFWCAQYWEVFYLWKIFIFFTNLFCLSNITLDDQGTSMNDFYWDNLAIIRHLLEILNTSFRQKLNISSYKIISGRKKFFSEK